MPTWDSTDLDSAAFEEGVVHESAANTDHDSASVLKQGYSAANPLLSANLLGYWPLHEDSGTTANDVSGNNNDGTVSGATLGVSGLLGTSAYSFDGTDDYVTMGDLAGFDDISEISVVCWTIPDRSPGSAKEVVSKSDGSSGTDVWGLYRGSDVFGAYLRTADDGLVFHEGTTSVSTGTVAMVAVTYDGSSTRLYVDGAEDESASQSGTIPSRASPVSLGARGAGDDRHYAGDLMGVWVYDTGLSASEIQAHYDVVNTRGRLIASAKTI